MNEEVIQIFKEMITLAQKGVIAASGLSPEEQVTQNYISLSNSNASEADALFAWTKSAVAHGYYNNLVAFHVMVGSSLNNKRFNLVDPLNDPISFRLTLTGCSDNASGISYAGGSDYADTNLDWTLITDSPNVTIGYLLSAILQNIFAGAIIDSRLNLFQSDSTNAVAYPNIAANSTGISYTGTAGAVGRKVFSRRGNGNVEFWDNGSKKGSIASPPNSISPANIFYHRSVLGIHPTTVVQKYGFVATEMTDQQVSDFDSDLVTLMTALGR